ncbi:hypothetical protein HMPREF0476_0583 [Kingella kingae ATCC 23330]|uniref:Uncharacterized protein n=1 Tax=Kingella kingae ATCC 23330 TaxID=887327 RepID=F5S5V0_KINKI|nr:hypothetical protein HMPREF0476_0583 [Kingella kingae ATCC 23330]
MQTAFVFANRLPLLWERAEERGWVTLSVQAAFKFAWSILLRYIASKLFKINKLLEIKKNFATIKSTTISS